MATLELTNPTTFRTTLGDLDGKKADASIIIGGFDESKTIPIINGYKWETAEKPLGEAFFTLNPTWFPSTSDKAVLSNFKDGLVSLEKSGTRWESFVKPNGNLESQIIFAEKPSFAVCEFEIASSGVEFWYQDTLANEYKYLSWLNDGKIPGFPTLESYLAGHTRPDNVVGSYAVYAPDKMHRKYKTGKVGHIYRPCLIDAKGKRKWLSQVIDAGKLKISLDFTGLVFPVILDPEVGYSTPGASGVGNAGYQYTTRFTAGDTFTTTTQYIYIFTTSAGNHKKIVVMSTSGVQPMSQLGTESVVDATEGWQSAATVVSIENGVVYHMSHVDEDAVGDAAYDASGTWSECYKWDSAYADGNDGGGSGFSCNTNYKFSHYVDDAGGGVSVDATVDDLTLTEYVAGINAEISIATGVDTLTLTEYVADVDLDVSVSAGIYALVLTEHSATINAEISISAGIDALVITEHSAAVNVGIGVSADVDNLILTEYTADIKADISISAGLDALTITEYSAGVSIGAIIIAVGVDNLVLTEYPALVNLTLNIAATVDDLVLTEFKAGVAIILGTALAIFETENANPPTVETARAAKTFIGADYIELTLTALVIPGDFYRLREDSPVVTIVNWCEYTIGIA